MYDHYFNILITVKIQKSYTIYFAVVFHLSHLIIIINIIANDAKIES